MHRLANDDLTVTIIDPARDRDRLGPRYCAAGYIFQIDDGGHGPLLSGPTYPDSFNWFDGQGIPDAFNLAPLRGIDRADARALILGVGICDLAAGVIEEHAEWEVRVVERGPDADGGRIDYRTRHAFDGYEVDLERVVRLHGRSVISWTKVVNRQSPQSRALPLSWFPHPFYPQPEKPELFRTSLAIGIPENPNYALGPNGFVDRTRLAPGHAGHYQAVELPAVSHPATFLQRHDKVGAVTATTSYSPTFLPIWGNGATFSFEPFLERSLAPGQAVEWTMAYDF